MTLSFHVDLLTSNRPLALLIEAEMTRRSSYECLAGKSSWHMLDVKWINAQEVTTSKHEHRSFCDRLWLMAPVRV